MTEYYELILRHRVQADGIHDPELEQPIIAKGFISLLMQKSIDINAEREALIDELYRKLKEKWMQKNKEGEQNDGET